MNENPKYNPVTQSQGPRRTAQRAGRAGSRKPTGSWGWSMEQGYPLGRGSRHANQVLGRAGGAQPSGQAEPGHANFMKKTTRAVWSGKLLTQLGRFRDLPAPLSGLVGWSCHRGRPRRPSHLARGSKKRRRMGIQVLKQTKTGVSLLKRFRKSCARL